VRRPTDRNRHPLLYGTVIFVVLIAAMPCAHLNDAHIHKEDIDPQQLGVCEDCAKTGDTWVKVRLCLYCGHVGCCDSSKNTHAAAHFKSTGHPVIQSAEIGEHWKWCYIDATYL
jgi:uncharacterized UBP type Zn finger protein